MSVPKSKRGKSKVEFEMTYFKLADGLDNLVVQTNHNINAEELYCLTH